MPYRLLAAPISQLSVEGYIFQQYAEARHKPLADVLDEVIPHGAIRGLFKDRIEPEFLCGPTLARRRWNCSEPITSPCLPSMSEARCTKKPEQTTPSSERSRSVNYARPSDAKPIVNNPDPKRNQSEKIDAELAVEAESLNRMGRTLAQHGFQLRVHHHTPQLVNHARVVALSSGAHRSAIRLHLALTWTGPMRAASIPSTSCKK